MLESEWAAVRRAGDRVRGDRGSPESAARWEGRLIDTCFLGIDWNLAITYIISVGTIPVFYYRGVKILTSEVRFVC